MISEAKTVSAFDLSAVIPQPDSNTSENASEHQPERSAEDFRELDYEISLLLRTQHSPLHQLLRSHNQKKQEVR